MDVFEQALEGGFSCRVSFDQDLLRSLDVQM